MPSSNLGQCEGPWQLGRARRSQLQMPPPISKSRVRLIYPGPAQAHQGGRYAASYLLLGRFILEAGMLDVIGPNGLVLLILGAQVLHSLGDGQPTALDVLTADPVKNGQWGWLQGGLGALLRRLRIPPGTLSCHGLICLWRARARQSGPTWRIPLGTVPLLQRRESYTHWICPM